MSKLFSLFLIKFLAFEKVYKILKPWDKYNKFSASPKNCFSDNLWSFSIILQPKQSF